MAGKFTKELRQKIINEYASKHGGKFDPAGFLKEVRLSNGTHAAWNWFEWNDGTAAEKWRLQQAAEFAQGLKIRFEVQTHSFENIKLVTAPAFVSPLSERSSGGGYKPFNPEIDLDELGRQAAQALITWFNRYEAVIVSRGLDRSDFDKAITVLDPPKLVAAE